MVRALSLLCVLVSLGWCGHVEGVDDRGDHRGFVIVLYGAPGCGSSAVAARLLEVFDFPVIFPARLLANHVLEGTALGDKARDYFVNGGPLPPELLPEILYDRLLQVDCERGVLFEELSLDREQVLVLQDKLSSRFRFLILSIETSDGWLIQRAEGRLVCHGCGRVYDDWVESCEHRERCEVCSEALQRRHLDSLEANKSRIESYRRRVDPVMAEYRRQGILVQIPGERRWEEVYRDVVRTIEERTGLAASKVPSGERVR